MTFLQSIVPAMTDNNEERMKPSAACAEGLKEGIGMPIKTDPMKTKKEATVTDRRLHGATMKTA